MNLNTNFQSGYSSNSDTVNFEIANPANLSFTPERLSNWLKTLNAANAADAANAGRLFGVVHGNAIQCLK